MSRFKKTGFYQFSQRNPYVCLPCIRNGVTGKVALNLTLLCVCVLLFLVVDFVLVFCRPRNMIGLCRGNCVRFDGGDKRGNLTLSYLSAVLSRRHKEISCPFPASSRCPEIVSIGHCVDGRVAESIIV